MEKVDLGMQNQWQAGPDEELKIPSVYITRLKYEIVVLDQKKEFTFRCSGYKRVRGGAWQFNNVIVDSSKLNEKGDVELKRVTYHPQLQLINATFMVMPAPEEID